MCGIFGAVRREGFYEREAFERFQGLTDLVRYRGPDDSGYLTLSFENKGVDGAQAFNVFLGHRRLSIIDLSSAGHQPMTDGKGRWIIYNGEILNYLELRTELQEAGHCFKTETDTEVILHVYGEYGESGFEKLNGMWAFAIADLPGKRVILSRDRFSMKPLYLLELKNDFYFASEIKQLLPLLPKREVQPEVMGAFLSQGLVDHTTDTFFRGISKVPAKTNFVICLNTGRTHTQQYWDYTAPGPQNVDDPVETFRQLFVDSVRIRLRSDVKVGVLLSGGLDSSAIATVVHGLAGGKLESYSVVSNDRQYSEEKYIDALCQATGIKNQKLLFQIPDVLEALERVVYHSDEPFASFSAIAHFKILEKIKQETDVTVLLSGQGGDETLLGYSKFFFFYIRELIANGQYPKAFAQFFWSILRRTVVRQFRLGEAKRYLPSAWGNGHRQAFIRLSGAHEPIWKCNGLRDRQIADLDRYSVPVLTHYEDRNPMAHSLELRHPFLDHRLVNFLLNLPAEWKIRNGWTKYVMRESLPELPRAIRWRRDKQGFILPEELWLKRDLSQLIQKTFRKSALAELGILDDREFLHYYEQFQQGKSNIWYTDISRTVIAEAWAKQFIGATVN
jgi:asparagine synthase (glutamine-hydrolysing)